MLSGFHTISHISVPAFMLLCMCVQACEQSCPTPPPPVCDKCEACPPQNVVTLAMLDSASRERLKQELLAEIKDEQAKQRPRDKQPQTQPAETEITAQAENQPVRAKRKPRPSVALQPSQPIEKDDRGLKVMRQSFTTEIARRLPVDDKTEFTVEDTSVFCFVEISSNADEERLITIKFVHSTGLTQSFELPVGQSPAWRTWSKLNLTSSMTGAWLCEVYNEEGVLLASKPFTVE